MIATNFSNLRDNFKSYCDKVNDDGETVIVTRKGNKNVVIISESEYNNIINTLKALTKQEYFAALDKSIRQIETGQTVTFEGDICEQDLFR